MAAVTLYKIRHKVTGLYRKAGGGWSKTGKAWANIGHVKNHLNCCRVYQPGLPYDKSFPLPGDSVNWEVVVLVIEESEAQKLEIEELWK